MPCDKCLHPPTFNGFAVISCPHDKKEEPPQETHCPTFYVLGGQDA